MNLKQQFLEEVTFAQSIFGFDKTPTVIPVSRRRVSIGKIGDEWFAGTPGKIEMARCYGKFDKLGKINKALRFIGRTLHWRWLYKKGRFTAYGEPLMFDILTITLDEYTMPTGYVISLGYAPESNILAIGPRNEI